MRKLLLFGVVLTTLVACSKYPGEGGRASISGTVMVEDRLVLTNPATVLDTYLGSDEDVFLIYGDGLTPDDRILAGPDGRFSFPNLRKGNYTLFVYSKDTTGLDGVNPNRMPISFDIEITERKEEIDLGDITIYTD